MQDSSYQITMFRRSLATLAMLAGAMLLAGPGHADSYTIQIGAFRTPSESFVEPARSVGEIYFNRRDSGLVALSVGRFDSFDEAQDKLPLLAGDFPGAYVRRAEADARSQFSASNTLSASAEAQPRKNAPSGTEDQLLASLSEAERKNVVYLDGKLHFKDGNRFIPLREYRSVTP
jgi:hypothetical protein